MINEQELQRICEIINKRNELQKKRGSARHKVLYYDDIIRSRHRLAKKKKLERQADKERNPHVKALRVMNEVHQNHKYEMRDTWCAVNDAISMLSRDAGNSIRSAEKQLEQEYMFRVTHPKKHDKTPLHKLKTIKQKYIAEREMASYEIMQHTEDTTLELRRLLKKNGMTLRTDSNGGYSHIAYNNEDGERKFIHSDKIKQLAFNATVENELAE